MQVFRYANNPYKTSKTNTHANDIAANGTGIFCFDPTRKAIAYTGNEITETSIDAHFLIEQFGNFAFGGQLNTLEIDENEIVSTGYGRYANIHSDNYEDYIYIPECYVVFSEF